MSDEDLDEIREEIDEKYEQVEGGNYYEILGVDEDASEDTISDRFRELAKEWHADSFKGHDLDEDYQEKVQEIFAEINNGYRTLSDPDQREEYDAALEAEDADIESVIDAESAFRRGQSLLDAGRTEPAHEKFREAQEQSEEHDYRAHYLYTEYLLISKDDEGRPKDTARAEEIAEELDDIHDELNDRKGWLFAFRGVVYQGLGKTSKAKRLYSEAQRLDPDNHLAERRLRLLKMRDQRDDDDGGFLSNLLSKFMPGS